MGVHKESLGITQRIVIIAGILIIAFVADYFCRKIVVPTIKKLTARTQASSDSTKNTLEMECSDEIAIFPSPLTLP